MGYWWEGSTTSAMPLTSASYVISQHNKIEIPTFEATIVITANNISVLLYMEDNGGCI